jgi:hypothetical protein
MRRRLIGIGVLLLLAWSCSGEGSFWVTVRFPDPQSKDKARDLAVYAIEPAEGSGCPALMDGTARPRDAGYAVEDRVDISMPATEGSRPLERVGPGQRLFFVEATDRQDQVFLRGCTSTQAGGKGVGTVIVVLEKLSECHITRQGQEWCDNLDNDCDGETDEDCTQCQADADCVDADSCLRGACTDGTCSTDPSPDGTGCDDGLYCTDNDQCATGTCAGTARDCSAESDDCNDGVCDEEAGACAKQALADGTGCDDGQYCTVGETCLSGACQGGQPQDCSAFDGECVEGLCNEDDDRCEGRPMADGEDCDDGQYCTVGETCLSGACQGSQPRDCSASGGSCVDGYCNEDQDRCVGTNLDAGTPCDDDLFCTENDACDDSGNCLGDPVDCSHLDDACNQGVCDELVDACAAHPANEGSSCEDGLYCTINDTCQSGTCTVGQLRDCSAFADQCHDGVCWESQDRCQAVDKPPGTACDDGIDCTSPDECDGAGICVGAPDDTLCPAGEYCRPACASAPDGCMPPPTLQVDCPDTPVPADQPAACIVTAEGLLNQASCITCVPHLLHLRTPITDFSQDGQPSVCDLDGWQLETGNLCLDWATTPDCPMNPLIPGPPGGCCDTFGCPVQTGPLAGRVALETNNDFCIDEGWRLYKYFDFLGFDNAEVCLHFGHISGDTQDIIQVQADDGSAPESIDPVCMSAANSLQGALAYSCVDLAATAVDWPQTRVTIWMQSGTSGHAWYIDDIEVKADYAAAACQPTTVVALVEDFSGCPATLPDGWNEWSITGTVRCDAGPCTGESLESRMLSGEWAIEHAVDTSALTGEVNLCWTVGDSPGALARLFEVEFDTGAGTGWQPAYQNAGKIKYGGDCDEICRNLAALDPAAAGNSNLKIRFHLDDLSGTIYLDDIVVSGPKRCDATGLLQAGAVTVMPAVNVYTVDVSNPGDVPYLVQLECDWGHLDPPVTASDSFRFTLP